VIDELHIAGLGVIEDATLRLAEGLTVVTGETGAGKTMLVTALQLLLGGRADSSLVRAGATRALAEAVLSPPPPEAHAWLDGDEELIVARELPADGRSRARINGRLAPVSALGEVLGRNVEVHGQHEHVRLARADVQRELLDRFAGEPHARTLAAYRQAHTTWRELVSAASG
jgi:DNA repair protein RecN (Recombination protein N)